MQTGKKIQSFDPNAPGDLSNNIFGLPFDVNNAKVVIVPLPWDATVSNKSGACYGPGNIKEQSYQIDLFDPVAPGMWKNGIAMDEIPGKILKTNLECLDKVEKFVRTTDGVKSRNINVRKKIIGEVNSTYKNILFETEQKCKKYLEEGKYVVLLGGDHSTALSLLNAVSAKNENFGILQLDAHADLRKSYEGFENSHASVMYNALNISQISKIVQVGVRDYCDEENETVVKNQQRIKMFTARDIYKLLFNNKSWNDICESIVDELPENVYISYDVDFLNPSECPTTGTPVPGGFSYEQSLYLVDKVVSAGKKIIGIDLVETGQGSLDGVISCRLLYRMIISMLQSNGFS